MAKQVHVAQQIRSVDSELTEHLKKAEEHLIAAIEMFAKKTKPDRNAYFLDRLNRAQGMVTAILREELVRARGPIRVTIKNAVKK